MAPVLKSGPRLGASFAAPNGDFSTGLGELDRVGKQIDQNLPNPVLIADVAERGSVVAEVLDRERFGVDLRAHQRERSADCFSDRRPLELDRHLTRFDLGDIENLVDQGEQMLTARPHPRHVLALLFIERTGDPHSQQVGVAQNGIERSADLVAHVR